MRGTDRSNRKDFRYESLANRLPWTSLAPWPSAFSPAADEAAPPPSRRPHPAVPGPIPRLCPGLGRLDLEPHRRNSSPIGKSRSIPKTSSAIGRPAAPRDGGHLRPALSKRKKSPSSPSGLKKSSSPTATIAPNSRIGPGRSGTDYEEAVPALPDFFTTARYIRAYDILHRLGRLTPPKTPRRRRSSPKASPISSAPRNGER